MPGKWKKNVQIITHTNWADPNWQSHYEVVSSKNYYVFGPIVYNNSGLYALGFHFNLYIYTIIPTYSLSTISFSSLNSFQCITIWKYSIRWWWKIVNINYFMIGLSLPYEWHETYHENSHYKSFSFPPFITDCQTNRKCSTYEVLQ